MADRVKQEVVEIINAVVNFNNDEHGNSHEHIEQAQTLLKNFGRKHSNSAQLVCVLLCLCHFVI